MAIYRSDQASVTFAPEANPGAFIENATISGNGGEIGSSARTLSVDAVAGATTLSLSGAADESSLGGNGTYYAIIGDDSASGTSGSNYGPREIRKVVDGDGTATVTLDHPLAFDHASGAPVKAAVIEAAALDALTSPTAKFITWLPGVYDAVDVPDPEQAFEPYYILGSQNRNFYTAYPGQETLAGSVGGMVLLNATPLRFPLGKIVTKPTDITATSWKVGTTTTANAASKGATRIPIFASGSTAAIAAGTYVMFGSGSHADASTFSTASSDNFEVRQILAASASGAGTAGILILNAPLQFEHAANTAISTVNATGPFYHTIYEKTALDSITMNVNVLDSSETAANTWQRRYVGGKVGSMAISAEEGGLVNVGWDGIQFLDMMHNVKNHPDLPANTYMPRYGLMSDIAPTNVGKVVYDSGVTYVRPSNAPYYFSQGVVKMFGDDPSSGTNAVELGRVRSFSISIANNEEPRYYISNQREGKRGPTEILEQRREYSMSATIATEDSEATYTDSRTLFKELLLAGDYRGTQGLRGFAIELTFTRSTNDSITIRIPGENFDSNANAGDGGNATSQGGEQGAFIRSATHNVSDANPIEADVDILFRSMIINIKDSEPVYP